ncbi:hypothetical protein Cgig2_026290 [Carnegiea gigantea]|uniref:Glycosyltransferase N-terminal domain-containing protein n=1 Tax=Carnegiea gigantea TaxID=171969 RepID=A0A9Q1KEL3_9CARY|nr:hypothetical protein Cgig2_026290 [Carnegiea gigantea]
MQYGCMHGLMYADENFLTNGDLDRVLDWVPALEGMSLRYLPTFIRTTSPDDFMLHYLRRLIHNSKRASALLFNTFDALDVDIFRAVSSDFPPLYAIGPLQFLLEPIEATNKDTNSIGSSLWKEDPRCINWLDSFAPDSVVYVNFGSITVMTNDQYVEFAWGLANSNHPFLWITRPDLVTGDSAVLSPEFLEKTKNRGLIASWCNQEKVLAHPAIGGFLTHSGWNSTLESIYNGIPMICWPFFAEQQTNCWFSCKKWGIGMEIDANVERSVVEMQVRELMEGEKGKEMRRKAAEWKRLAQEAAAPPNGSSYCNLDHVIAKRERERMGSLSRDRKPHLVCIPYPAQGHINPMMQLAKILHSRNFHITFVHTEFNRNRLLRSAGPNALGGLPSFRFEAIPDGLAPTDANATQDIPSLCRSIELHCLRPFMDLLRRVNRSGVAPVSCIVSDVAMSFTLDAAKELGVPEVMLWTSSPCGFQGCALYDMLIQLDLVPFKDENFLINGDIDWVLDWVPAMEGMSLRYLPTFIRTTNPDDFMLHYVRRLIHNSRRASALLFNSFDALDRDIFQAVASDFPPLYAIGPLQFLLKPIEAEDEDAKSIGSSLWKEDPRCINWLDSFAPDSVVYVNFGSITVMTNDQYVEFAWGLANSNHPFLWITRPDLVTGDSTFLPPEFLEKTKNRGLIASWCNQEKVLAHPAIGGFLTHSGWNSTLESIYNGIPMICWPFFAEQQTNCWFSCKKWGIGMEIDANVERSVVEMQVRELMEGEKGKEMRRKAAEWKRLAQEAAAPPNGSSYCNLDHVITKVLHAWN